MITGIHDVTVNVSDLARAAAFYGDRLRFKLLSEADDECVYDLGGMRFHVRAGSRPHAADKHTGVILTLAVRDVFTMVDHLRTEAVTFLGDIQHSDDGNAALFSDPDGNVFRLLQPSHR